MALKAVALESTKLIEPVKFVFERYRTMAEKGEIPIKAVRVPDYRRWSYILSLIEKKYECLMDIGIGHGQFIESASRSGMFGRIKGADIRRYSGPLEHLFEFVSYDLTTAPDRNLRSPIVTCMECIEHIPDPLFDQAVANLKVLATQRLIVTVPYSEREPLPKFHHQRFTVRRLVSLFPNSEITLLAYGSSIPWALVDMQL